MHHIQTLHFSINNWSHLYSLQQAVARNEQNTGRTLSLHGRILNQPFLLNKDTEITINLLQQDNTPKYPQLKNPQLNMAENSPPVFILGIMTLRQQELFADISVDRNVFEELRKNLMEYADIEGIQIKINLGLIGQTEHWQDGQSLQIIQLDYAMKGQP